MEIGKTCCRPIQIDKACIVILLLFRMHSGRPTISKGEINPIDPIVRVGDDLKLNCTITAFDDSADNSSSLYFVSGFDDVALAPVISSQYYIIIDRSTLQLHIPLVNHSHQDTYRCYMKDITPVYVASMNVRVGKPPDNITEIKVLSENLENLNVTWCTTNVPQDLHTYQLNWTIHYPFESEICPNLRNTVNCFSCLWESDISQGSEFFEGTYAITIFGWSIYGKSTSSFVIVSSEYVKPNPAHHLSVKELNSTTVQLFWQPPSNFFMQLNFSVQQVQNTYSYSFKTYDVSQENSAVLRDLKPGSGYTVLVKCIPTQGGFWSAENQITFQTWDDVPGVSPEIPPGWFYSPQCEDVRNSFPCPGKQKCQQVTLFWKPIPKEMTNGNILGYQIQYEDYSGKIQAKNTSSHYAQIQLPQNRDHVIALFAYNSRGISKPLKSVLNSNCHEIARPTLLFAETITAEQTVIIQWNAVFDAMNYTLLYCLGSSQCLGEPQLKVIPRNVTELTLFNVTEYVFALSVNTEQGSTGLIWICVYDYYGEIPAPSFTTTSESKENDAIIIRWQSVLCDSRSLKTNSGRPINYTVTYKAEDTTAKEESVVVPGNTTHLVIRGLHPGYNYSISVQGNSRFRKGKVKQVFYQMNSAPVSDYQGRIIIAIIIAILVILAITVATIKIKKLRKRLCHLPIKIPSIVDLNTFSKVQRKTEDRTSIDEYTMISDENKESLLGKEEAILPEELDSVVEENKESETMPFHNRHNSSASGSSYSCYTSKTTYIDSEITFQDMQLGPAEPVNYGISLDDISPTVELRAELVASVSNQNDEISRETIEKDASNSSTKTRNHVSGDYSKAVCLWR